MTVGLGYVYNPWIAPPGQGFSAQNTVDASNQSLYACFAPTIPGAVASVCWVCADVSTQLLSHSGYSLVTYMLNDPNVARNGDPLNIGRQVGDVGQYYRDHGRTQNEGSVALLLGSPITHPYNNGDSVVISNDPSLFASLPLGDGSNFADQYHMGIIVRGGTSLDDILIAQLSYSAEGFFHSVDDMIINSTIPGHPGSRAVGTGRFEVITLRTYLARDATTRNNPRPIPSRSDPNYDQEFSQLADADALHGIPQQGG